MGFSEEVQPLLEVLSSIGSEVNISDYDGVFVKKLAATNTLTEENTGNATHIAITGDQMNFFPYVELPGYFDAPIEEKDDDLKQFFMGQIAGTLTGKNVEYLGGQCDYNTKDIYVTVWGSRRKDGSKQLQMSATRKDSPEFIEFRKLIHANSYLVILKRKQLLKYDFYAIKEETAHKYPNFASGFEAYYGKDKSSTIVHLDDYLETPSENSSQQTPQLKMLSKNRILYGAPGTGKSYTLKEDAKVFVAANMERVTFHPAYSYAQFFGSFKPISEQIGEKTDIAYKFVPGPFLRVLLKALANPSQNYLLVIEEINRANVAAVFGDVFQLLDRKNGESEYPIAISDELFNYITNDFNQQVQVEGYERAISIPRNDKKIKIPANMYIWATMNSADQGVQPMDTAFKRRWDFEYIKINDGESETNIDIKLELFDGNTQSFNWNELRHHINKILADNGVPEDKCLGPFFINKDTLKDNVKFKNAFENKVLMYLYEDAAQYCRGLMFSKQNDDFQFAELLKDFENKGVEVIFNFKATTNEQSEQSGDN